MTARKSAKDSAKHPKLIRQPNGRGALLSGGVPGNKGGGRPPDFLKALKQQGAEKATEQIHELLKTKALDPDQLIKIAKEFDATPQKVDVDATLTIRFE